MSGEMKDCNGYLLVFEDFFFPQKLHVCVYQQYQS